MIRALLDTNVILDLLLGRPPFADEATDLWDANRGGRFTGYISAIAPPTIYYIGRRQMGAAAARRGIGIVLAAFSVCPVDGVLLKSALALPISDYEDAVQHASATTAQVDAIVTRDLGDFTGSTLPVYSPRDFLKLLP